MNHRAPRFLKNFDTGYPGYDVFTTTPHKRNYLLNDTSIDGSKKQRIEKEYPRENKYYKKEKKIPFHK